MNDDVNLLVKIFLRGLRAVGLDDVNPDIVRCQTMLEELSQVFPILTHGKF